MVEALGAVSGILVPRRHAGILRIFDGQLGMLQEFESGKVGGGSGVH